MNPETGVCTNSVEGQLVRIEKVYEEEASNVSLEHLPSCLDEFMWRNFYDNRIAGETMLHLLHHLSTWNERAHLRILNG